MKEKCLILTCVDNERALRVLEFLYGSEPLDSIVEVFGDLNLERHPVWADLGQGEGLFEMEEDPVMEAVVTVLPLEGQTKCIKKFIVRWGRIGLLPV
jgi:hypothetical protein